MNENNDTLLPPLVVMVVVAASCLSGALLIESKLLMHLQVDCELQTAVE